MPDKIIHCKDNSQHSCGVKVSTRGPFISLFVKGGDEWAHMNPETALKLAEFLVECSEYQLRNMISTENRRGHNPHENPYITRLDELLERFRE